MDPIVKSRQNPAEFKLGIQLQVQHDGAAPVLPLLWFLLLPLLLILPLRVKNPLWSLAEQGVFPRAAKLIHDQRAAEQAEMEEKRRTKKIEQ